MQKDMNSIENAPEDSVEIEGGSNGEAVIASDNAPVLKKKKSRLNNQDRYALAAFLFILPFLIGFAVFKLAPCIVSLQLSFSTVVRCV